MQRQILIKSESWPLAKVFTISRGSKTHAEVITLKITQENVSGFAESVPYNRYGESIDSVTKQIQFVQKHLENGADRDTINSILPAGAARNAIDCALWDLDCKLQQKDIFDLSKQGINKPTITAQTLCIGDLESMAQEAKTLANYPLIKVKLDDQMVIEKMSAIHRNAPNSQFIIDPNEGWSFEQLKSFAPKLAQLNVALLEQPLASDDDSELVAYDCPIPICADESLHTRSDLPIIKAKYQYINIKLDKTGGLTEALQLVKDAKKLDLGIMVGCMVGTSLAMAPANVIANEAKFIDLDGPALLSKDKDFGFQYHFGQMSELNFKLWGGKH